MDQPLSGTGTKCISSAPSSSRARCSSVSGATTSGGGRAAAAAAARARSRLPATHALIPPKALSTNSSTRKPLEPGAASAPPDVGGDPNK